MYNYDLIAVAGVCENLRDIANRLSNYANKLGPYSVQDVIEDTIEIFRACFYLDMLLKDLDELSEIPVLETNIVHSMEED